MNVCIYIKTLYTGVFLSCYNKPHRKQIKRHCSHSRLLRAQYLSSMNFGSFCSACLQLLWCVWAAVAYLLQILCYWETGNIWTISVYSLLNENRNQASGLKCWHLITFWHIKFSWLGFFLMPSVARYQAPLLEPCFSRKPPGSIFSRTLTHRKHSCSARKSFADCC